ncbi:Ppx/GppA phosphatase family protein [Campylobacter sp. US33a]|uniref:Ppx/GppA phosphatase family protein n=1 Tax=Campylobacter sp. US33a TaxID=2498120 RepID=UPI0010686171|nr:Ppx/GppA phosphatase family protein [Campylobacter sp. US33a]TEY03487.1 Ppx/GppA family phosphatase [Campylobacter sp. US33a]
MAKRTAVVDLGSNSIRMVVFEKTSRYAFHVIGEYKQKVRLGENAYNNGKILQAEAMSKAEEVLAFFKEKAIKNKCKKMLIVGTSALRDAPNSKEFIKRIWNNLGLHIRCIDGKTESYLGGVAAVNLLGGFDNATTLDIGGGSSELCLIKNGKIVDALSLDIGTVRLKELFYDNNKQEKLEEFLKPILGLIPSHFKNENLIAIGGSLRAISSSIMQKNSYPLKILHGFCYLLKDEKAHINKISTASPDFLANCGIKKDRFDTIQEGALIFLKVIEKLGSKRVITSGVGVREGVYLQDLLRPLHTFPASFNPSIKSLQDRFFWDKKCVIPYYATQIFDSLISVHNLQSSYKQILIWAAKLSYIGRYLNFYFSNEHSAYMALHGLNYGFTHEQKVLISVLIRLNGKKITPYNLDPYQSLLPDTQVIVWLNFILALAKIIAVFSHDCKKIHFNYTQNVLHIYANSKLEMISDEIKKINKPISVNLIYKENF